MFEKGLEKLTNDNKVPVQRHGEKNSELRNSFQTCKGIVNLLFILPT